MNFPAVLAQLNDLPSTFKPAGGWYDLLIDLWLLEQRYSPTVPMLLMQQVLDFTNAIDGWIDFWGLLFGVPRNTNEGNIPYATRITETVLAWVGTLPAMQVWINLFAPGGSVVENSSGLGYVITMPAAMTLTQITSFVVSLGRIRPAGVPFTLMQSGLGIYLGTEAFLGDGVTLGTYLSSGSAPSLIGLNATTTSAQPLLPTLWLSDPLLNPLLAA